MSPDSRTALASRDQNKRPTGGAMGCTLTGGICGAIPTGEGSASLTSWAPAFSMMLVSSISYIDRNTLALLAPAILRDSHLTNQQYGLIISGFSVAYMLCNPLWGWIVDRMGVARSMAVAVSMWTLASVSHSFASGFHGFAAARTALGIGEAATYPGAVRTVTQTLPRGTQMRGLGLVYCGGSLGALLTPIIITPLAAEWGWRAGFWFTGVVGVLWLGLWAAISRHPNLGRIATVAETNVKLHWNDRRLWAFLCLYAAGGAPIAFVLYQSSIYLSLMFHKSQVEIGRVLWIPPLGWEFGFLFWGWVTDRIARSGDPRRRLRRQFLLLTVLSLPLAATAHVNSYPMTLAVLFCAMFVMPGFNIGALANAAKHYSTDKSGLIAGLASGTWSAVVAVEMPLVGKLFDTHSYDGAFVLATLFPVFGYLSWRALDR